MESYKDITNQNEMFNLIKVTFKGATDKKAGKIYCESQRFPSKKFITTNYGNGIYQVMNQLVDMGFNIIGRCEGINNVSYIITDTFKPFK